MGVTTGFSKPYVAVYAASAGAVTYSKGMVLARGVDVNLEVETSEDNNFYTDNVLAESASGVFTGGTLTLTVDGLEESARKLISGITATKIISVGSESQTVDVYDDDQVIPYVGVGFIARKMMNGVTTYTAVVLKKCVFSEPGLEAATQEDEIDWQTQSLEATIMRDDSAKHEWKYVKDGLTSEADAEALIKAVFSIK